MVMFLQYRVDRNLRKFADTSNSDWHQRRVFIDRLAKLGEPRAIEPIVDALTKGFEQKDIESLACFGVKAMPELLRIFEATDNTFQRYMVGNVFEKIGVLALPDLKQLLHRQSVAIHALIVAMSAIGRIVSENPGALERQKHVDSGRMRLEDLEGRLASFVIHPDQQVSTQAILSLGFIGSERHLDRLVELLNLRETRENHSTIICAAKALGYVRSSRAIAALMTTQPDHSAMATTPDSPGERFLQDLHDACELSLNRLRNGVPA